MSSRGSTYKNMFVTAAGTAGSRVLGLVRDQLTAIFFGTSGVAGAFIIAFQIPNLFRRLLGEGAFTAALMPSMTKERERHGNAGAFRFLNQALTRTIPWLLLIMAIFVAAALAIAFLPNEILTKISALFGNDSLGNAEIERYRLAAKLTAICMPYMPMICVAAVFTAALNLLGKFTVTALSAIWLNISMIFSLGILGWIFGETPEERVFWLCGGAIVGGIFQLVVPAIALFRSGWRARIDFQTSDSWQNLKAMFVPALVGAGVNQLNIFMTRFLAFSLDERAIAVYYYANRIVEIPVGIFTVTVTTVVFRNFAKHAAANDFQNLGATFSSGVRMILAINVPAMLGIIVLSQPLIFSFFQHGNFSAEDTALTVPVLCIFALAVPFYALSGIVGRVFNSLQDTKVQMRSGILAFAVNLVLVPILGWHFKACGLACANLIAAIAQCAMLICVLWRRERRIFSEPLVPAFLKVLAAAILMAAGTAILWKFFFKIFSAGTSEFLTKFFSENASGTPLISTILCFFAVVPAAVAIYFFALKILRFPECDELLSLFLKKFLKRKNKLSQNGK